MYFRKCRVPVAILDSAGGFWGAALIPDFNKNS